MKKSRFTLVELITVMIVIIILFGIGAAALVGLTTKKGPDGGTRMMTRMIELSRQHAIATNTRIAMMMPMEATLSTPTVYFSYTDRMPVANDVGRIGTTTTTDAPGIVMRPAVVDSAGNFLRWVEDTEWINIPPSTYFTSMTGLSDITYTMPVTDKRVINDGTVKALVFKPNGSLAGSTVDAVVYVKPFSANLGGTKYDPGSAHRYAITVNWLTGAISTMVDTDAGYAASHGKY